MLVNGGKTVFDQMGGILVNGFGTKDPAMLAAPADMQVGKRWRTAFNNTPPGRPTSRNYYDCRVLALEEVEVPAGRVLCFRVEAKGEAVLPKGGRTLNTTTWIDPATMLLVRQDVQHSTRDGSTVLEHTRDALLWRKQVPRA